MELAWLSDDAGRGGPAVASGGVDIGAPVETDRGVVPSIGGGASVESAGLLESDGGAPADEEGRPCGGSIGEAPP